MSAITAIKLNSAQTQTAPFCFGQYFKQGDVPAGQFAQLDIAGAAVEPMNTWPADGSLRTALIIGSVDLTANVAKQVNIVLRDTPHPTGIVLTANDIKASLAAAESSNPGKILNIAFSGGTLGSVGVNFAALIAAGTMVPTRVYVSNRAMVECHYQTTVGSDTSMYVQAHVRRFADGRMSGRIVSGCGYLDTSRRVGKTYNVNTFIGGVDRFNYGGVLYNHSALARWDATGWIGTDPAITPTHDTGYLVRTGLVPNYWKFGTPSAAALTFLNANKTYAPGENVQWSVYMPDYGYQEQIGLLPRWDALFVVTKGHRSALESVIAHARAINSYPHSYPDTTTLGPFKLSDYPEHSAYGFRQGAMQYIDTKKGDGTTALTWEVNHHGLPAYLAALLMGDYYYHETLQYAARMPYLCSQFDAGLGVNREIKKRLQNRGRAWSMRTIGAACAILPDRLNAEFGEIKPWLANLIDKYDVTYTDAYTSSAAFLGMEDLYGNRLVDSSSVAPDGAMCAGTAFWEHDFNSSSWSWLSDLAPLPAANMVKARKFRTYLHGNAVMRAGGDGPDEYNVAYAIPYESYFRINTAVNANYTPVPHNTWIATNPGQVFTDTFSTSPTDIKVNGPQNIMQGTSGGNPGISTGYWANYLPALSYAVDQGTPGAAEGWARLIAKTNWNMQAGADYDNVAQFGIVPKSYSQQPIQFTAVDSGVTVPATGPSIRCDALSVYTDSFQVTNVIGVGITPNLIPVGSILDGVAAGGLSTDEYRCELAGTYTTDEFVDDLSSGTFLEPLGTKTLTFNIFCNGALIGTRDVVLNVVASGTVAVPSVTVQGKTIKVSGIADRKNDSAASAVMYLDPQPSGAALGPFPITASSLDYVLQKVLTVGGKFKVRIAVTALGQTTTVSTAGSITAVAASGSPRLPF